MIQKQFNIKKMPFFQSFIPNSNTKAIIDINEFNIWLEQLGQVDFLSESDEKERTDAYNELQSGQALNLKDAMERW